MPFDIPQKAKMPQGTLINCKSDNDNQIIACVLNHDEEHNRIVHITIIVYGPSVLLSNPPKQQSFSIGFVPIDYEKLLESAIGVRERDDSFFRISHGVYANGHGMWLESHVEDRKTFFTHTVDKIVEMAQKNFGLSWGKHPPAFFPASQKYITQLKDDETKFLTEETGKTI